MDFYLYIIVLHRNLYLKNHKANLYFPTQFPKLYFILFDVTMKNLYFKFVNFNYIRGSNFLPL